MRHEESDDSNNDKNASVNDIEEKFFSKEKGAMVHTNEKNTKEVNSMSINEIDKEINLLRESYEFDYTIDIIDEETRYFREENDLTHL